jgi:hypothetical protein
MTKKKWIFVIAPFAMALFIAIGGEIVMLLWNWLLPRLFGFPQITFWQAVGLLALCRILFGGLGIRGRGVGSNMGRRMAEHWTRMTPEEREKFRQKILKNWGEAPQDPKTSA